MTNAPLKNLVKLRQMPWNPQ